MLLPGPLRNILRGARGDSGPEHRPAAGTPSISTPNRAAPAETSHSVRVSRGLEEFFQYIRGQSGLTILDLGGATQQNISFITNLGHRLYSQDFPRTLTEVFGAPDAAQANPGQIDFFLRQTMDFPEEHFDAVLLWDSL